MPATTPAAIDIEPVRQAAIDALAAARVHSGRYRRFLPGSDADPESHLLYGTAAAANIAYTIGCFPGTDDDAERQAFVATLRTGQDPSTGLFEVPDHGSIHATANVTSALELFDARPTHPLAELASMLAGRALERTLDGLAWVGNPWGASHTGAGAYAALHIAGELPDGSAQAYFDWFWAEQDPTTGLWRRGCQPGQTPASAPLFDHLAGSFHYLFNHVAAGRPWRYPERLIDTALRVRAEHRYVLGAGPGFAEVDWVYCLTRSVRLCGHRASDVDTALRSFAAEYAWTLLDRVRGRAVPFDDLHTLHGTLAALAELQQALPDALTTRVPLRLVLDRRPFL